MFQVNTSLIRFWEKEFDIIKPKKIKRGGIASSPPEDVENFRIIYHLVKERGFTLKGAKEETQPNRDKTIEIQKS